ncbi:MAG: LysR family transcriptional regulator [Acidobacteria bacterium]|nr:LysR family transcriptional regulator [Acidobacteriota bacterium]
MSRGAALNDISQSAASQHIQELERIVGMDLIDRSRRPIQLTEAGHLYLGLCRDLLRRSEEFNNAISQLKTAVVGTVRVASIFSVGLVEMSRLESLFAQRFPQATLEVEYVRPEKVYESIRGDKADLGLVSYPNSGKDISVIPWREEEMVVAAAPSHPIALLTKVQPNDLDGMEFIAFDPELPIRKDVDRFLKDSSVAVKISKHFDSIPMVKEALSLGNCVSIVPARMMRGEIAEGRLVGIPLEAPGLIRPLGIIYSRKKRLNRAAQAFLDLLQEAEQPQVTVG